MRNPLASDIQRQNFDVTMYTQIKHLQAVKVIMIVLSDVIVKGQGEGIRWVVCVLQISFT